MIKIIRSNKVAFYSIIFIWVLAGSVVFNYSLANASNTNDQQDYYKYIRLFSDVLLKLRENYVEEISFKELIEYAIKLSEYIDKE